MRKQQLIPVTSWSTQTTTRRNDVKTACCSMINCVPVPSILACPVLTTRKTPFMRRTLPGWQRLPTTTHHNCYRDMALSQSMQQCAGTGCNVDEGREYYKMQASGSFRERSIARMTETTYSNAPQLLGGHGLAPMHSTMCKHSMQCYKDGNTTICKPLAPLE